MMKSATRVCLSLKVIFMPSTIEDLRVLVVGDSPLARAGLAALLSNQPGCEVIGQVSGAELADLLDVYRPDALIWDLGWEPAQSLERLTEMGNPTPQPPPHTWRGGEKPGA